MIQTYENMRNLATLYTDGGTLSEVAMHYQEEQNPIFLSYVFTELFPLLLKVSNRYHNLDSHEKASYVVEEVHRAMMAFDPNIAKVQTLIMTYVNARLRSETQMCNHQVRVLNYCATSYEEITATKDGKSDDTSQGEFSSKIKNDESSELRATYIESNYEDAELKEALKMLDLSENEIACCSIIIDEQHELKDTEIAEKLGVTSMAVAYMKKRLRVKLQPIFA